MTLTPQEIKEAKATAKRWNDSLADFGGCVVVAEVVDHFAKRKAAESEAAESSKSGKKPAQAQGAGKLKFDSVRSRTR